MSEIVNKLNHLASNKKSDWILDAEKRNENKEWLKHSQMIALKVLRSLKAKKMTQKDLAFKMNMKPQQVNKIVKGKENITLETISKLEKALEINLILGAVSDEKKETNYIIREKLIYLKIQENHEPIKKQAPTPSVSINLNIKSSNENISKIA